MVVPCCQAEVASVLRKNKAKALADPLAEIWRHPLHTREFGSQITNVLRCLQLEAHGYQVSVTELVGWEHSMKNELIIAQYKDLPRRKPAERLREMLERIGLQELKERFFWLRVRLGAVIEWVKDRLRSFCFGRGIERDKSATLWHACFPALRLILALRSHQRSPGLTAGFNRSGQPLQQRRFTSVGRRTSLLWAGLGWGTFACAGCSCYRSVNPALRPPTPVDSGARAPYPTGGCDE